MSHEVRAKMSAGKREIGARLRAARKDRGWDKPEMIARLREAAGNGRASLPDHASLYSYLRRWENGTVGVSERYRMLYSRAFGLDEAILFGAAAETATWRVPGVPLFGSFSPDDEERLIAAARRPRRHDPAVVDALGAVLAGQRLAEDIMGSESLIEPVRAQLTVVAELVREARGDLRAGILGMAEQWSQFAGWLYTSIGDRQGAEFWFDRAAEWSVEVDDPTMFSTVLSFKGHLAWMVGNIGPMIGLSQAAQRDQGIAAGQLAYNAHQEARGHAMAGDGDMTDRKIEEAIALAMVADEHPEKEKPWTYFYTPDFFTMQSGLAYRYLGDGEPERNREAIRLLEGGLAGLSHTERHSEWAAEFVYHLAISYLQAGMPEKAAQSGLEAAECARRTGTKRLHGQLLSLNQRLSQRWPKRPEIAQLGQALSDCRHNDDEHRHHKGEERRP